MTRLNIDNLAQDVSPQLLAECGIAACLIDALTRAIERHCDRLDFIYVVDLDEFDGTARLTLLDADDMVNERWVWVS